MKRSFHSVSMLFLFLLFSREILSQSYTISTDVKEYDCTKGALGVNIGGLQGGDVLSIIWSNGRTNVNSISELEVGDYTVELKIPTKLDTTIQLKVEKTECLVTISNHFTPNDDGYNDSWGISNTEYFPNFHLYVFDKWGQQVHKQSGTYIKWNGHLGGSGIPVADGTYYYVFYYEGSSGKLLKGDLTILR